jgi:hypothetical protein
LRLLRHLRGDQTVIQWPHTPRWSHSCE